MEVASSGRRGEGAEEQALAVPALGAVTATPHLTIPVPGARAEGGRQGARGPVSKPLGRVG